MSAYDFDYFGDIDGLGWSSFFASALDSLVGSHGLVPARVARAEREQYLLMHHRGLSRAVPAGKLRYGAPGSGGLPVVGDWVAARMGDQAFNDTGLGDTGLGDPASGDSVRYDSARSGSNQSDPIRRDSARDDLAQGGLTRCGTTPSGPIGKAYETVRIEAVLPRRTLLARLDPSGASAGQPLAANVDLVLLTAGLDHDFNPRRLERGAALARQTGAEPVVVLTKVDLEPDHGRHLSRVMAAVPGAEALAVSARTGQGMDGLRALLMPGVTAVLLGSSGTGKSTLVNRLLGEERQRTAEVRRDDSRGRHATTHRELFVLPGGGLLVDTPGLRAFGLTGEQGMEEVFADVERFAAHCRFRDCRHESEPGCGVTAAVERGDLAAERYASYLKLRREAESLERRRAQGPDLESKGRDKALSRELKRYKKWSKR